MAPEGKGRFWRKCRIYFRRFRIAVLLLMLGLLGAAIYLELHGLPGFIQRPLLDKLRTRGLDLNFSRLRLRFYRGLVAEDVSFGQAQDPGGPRLSAREVELHLEGDALWRMQLQVDELNLRGARLVWPVGGTNAPGERRVLAVDDIDARLRLLPGDEWALDNFRARFAGARFVLSGTVTNASAIRQWKFPKAETTTPSLPWPERLRRLADTLDRISFSKPPELWLTLDGDARDWQSFTARLALNAHGADTPWGQATNLVFKARLFPGAGGELSHMEINLQADDARTPWAEAAQLLLDAHVDTVAANTNLLDCDVTLRAARAVTQWAAVTNVQLTGRWIHSLTNLIPVSGQGELRADSAHTEWANGEDIRLVFGLASSTNAPPAHASWAWWSQLQPYEIDWDLLSARAIYKDVAARNVHCGGSWRAPVLNITNLQARLFDGSVKTQSRLDVATREAQFTLTSDFDAKKLSSVLPGEANRWMSQFTWVESPRVWGSGIVTLPAWTNREPDWDREVMPTMKLAGEFAVTNAAFRGLTASWARSHLTYTNKIWSLPDLMAVRPEGELRLRHLADDNTQDYYFGINSTVDVRAVRPLLSADAQKALDWLKFTNNPVIEGEVWGRWHDDEKIGFRAHLALTNFSFREQSADSVVAEMRYTNRVLDVFEPRVWRGTQVLSAAGVRADFNTRRIHFTNGYSTTEPMVVARCIGPQTARDFEPFVFKVPPVVYIQGYAPMGDSPDSDLRFDFTGQSFEWRWFKLPRVKGNAHWRGDILQLTNIQTEFYFGAARGHAGFDFHRERPGTDFNFTLIVNDAQLGMLMADLDSPTNKLKGQLNGYLVVTNANTDNFHSWNGYGKAELKDGVIMEIPMLGALTKLLDSAVPGLGSSTISQGSGRFSISNSVIYSRDLEMRAAAMRLQYDGSVDFDGRVNARIEAQPLRDAWVVGRLLSLALWPVAKVFEYKATGTLQDPKLEPLYAPAKLFLAPFHPIQSLEDLFTNDSPKTNAPPIFRQP